MDEIADLLAHHRDRAAELATDVPAPPRRRLAVVTCMDARLDPLRTLGLEIGDAHVIRNAGGRASVDALRSLLLSTHLLGTRTVLVVHHTDCGLSRGPEETRRALADAGGDPGEIDLLAFDDLEESVREDVCAIVSSGLLPDDVTVRGFVHDVTTGLLREVTPG